MALYGTIMSFVIWYVNKASVKIFGFDQVAHATKRFLLNREMQLRPVMQIGGRD